jgi:hypothetical protein
MAGPFLDTLSRAARAAWPFIQRGVREGLSSRSIERALVEGGLSGVRRSTLLDLMRMSAFEQRAGDALNRLQPNRRIEAQALPEALTKIRRSFSFTVDVTGTLISTGKSITRSITIASDRELTPLEIRQAAVAAVDAAGDRYGMTVEETKITGGRRAGSLGLI